MHLQKIQSNMLCSRMYTTFYFFCFNKERAHMVGNGVNILAEWHWAMAKEALLFQHLIYFFNSLLLASNFR